jgi:hypothetical protein
VADACGSGGVTVRQFLADALLVVGVVLGGGSLVVGLGMLFAGRLSRGAKLIWDGGALLFCCVVLYLVVAPSSPAGPSEAQEQAWRVSAATRISASQLRAMVAEAQTAGLQVQRILDQGGSLGWDQCDQAIEPMTTLEDPAITPIDPPTSELAALTRQLEQARGQLLAAAREVYRRGDAARAKRLVQQGLSALGRVRDALADL